MPPPSRAPAPTIPAMPSRVREADPTPSPTNQASPGPRNSGSTRASPARSAPAPGTEPRSVTPLASREPGSPRTTAPRVSRCSSSSRARCCSSPARSRCSHSLGRGGCSASPSLLHAATTTVVTLTMLHVMAGPKRAIRVGDRPSARPTRGAGRRADLVDSAWNVCFATTTDGCDPHPRRNRHKRRRRLNPSRDRRWRDIRTGFVRDTPGSRPKRKALRDDTACSWSPTRTWPRRTRS